MNQNIKIDPYGFREYDARWLYEKDINSAGIENLGKGLGTQITKQTNKTNPKVIVGHDYRSYSENVKKNFVKGLISTGCNVQDIGLCLSPTVYFSQFKLKSKDFYEITKRTLAATNEFTKGKVISILEGGYDLNALSESANEHVNALVEFN